jgi:transcriptional regulator with XRE-family HTH domain
MFPGKTAYTTAPPYRPVSSRIRQLGSNLGSKMAAARRPCAQTERRNNAPARRRRAAGGRKRPIHPTAGRHLAQIRTARRLTQRDLALLLRVTSITVQNWERGRADIPLGRLPQLAGALACSEGELLQPPGEPVSPVGRVQRPGAGQGRSITAAGGFGRRGGIHHRSLPSKPAGGRKSESVDPDIPSRPHAAPAPKREGRPHGPPSSNTHR